MKALDCETFSIQSKILLLTFVCFNSRGKFFWRICCKANNNIKKRSQEKLAALRNRPHYSNKKQMLSVIRNKQYFWIDFALNK